MTAPTLEHLLERARALATRDGRAVLGVTGAPGSGKSTLAAWLVDRLAAAPHPRAGAVPEEPWVAHVPMDGFHLADVQLERLGLRDRKGAPETFDGDGYVALLRRLHDDPDHVVYAPGFERTIEQPVAASIAVTPHARLVVTEGNYLLLPDGPWAALRGLLDEVWYCDAQESRRLDQLVARHEEFGKPPSAAYEWSTGPDERNAALVRATRDRADVVVPDAELRRLRA